MKVLEKMVSKKCNNLKILKKKLISDIRCTLYLYVAHFIKFYHGILRSGHWSKYFSQDL